MSDTGRFFSIFFVSKGSLQSLDRTSGLDWWTGLVDWTGGLTFFMLKITFVICNET